AGERQGSKQNRRGDYPGSPSARVKTAHISPGPVPDGADRPIRSHPFAARPSRCGIGVSRASLQPSGHHRCRLWRDRGAIALPARRGVYSRIGRGEGLPAARRITIFPAPELRAEFRMADPERPWSVPIRVEEVPEAGRRVELAADEPVRRSVAEAAGVNAVTRLDATFDLARHGRSGLHVTG